MPTFDEREGAFENKFAHDEEVNFKILARAYKMLGLWAAGKLGKSGETAENYASALVEQDIAAHGKSTVQGQILKDFTAAGVGQSEHQIARHFEEFRARAKEQLARK